PLEKWSCETRYCPERNGWRDRRRCRAHRRMPARSSWRRLLHQLECPAGVALAPIGVPIAISQHQADDFGPIEDCHSDIECSSDRHGATGDGMWDDDLARSAIDGLYDSDRSGHGIALENALR